MQSRSPKNCLNYSRHSVGKHPLEPEFHYIAIQLAYVRGPFGRQARRLALLYYGALKLLDPAKDTATEPSWKSFVWQLISLCFVFDDEVLGKGFFLKKA